MAAGREFHLDALSSDPQLAIQQMNRHIEALNYIIAQLLSNQYPVKHSPPLKPRPGLVEFADGTDWNPGAGEGTYEYRSDGLWHKL